MIDIQIYLLIAGILGLSGVLLSKVSSYIGIPSLIVFLILGLFFNGYDFIYPSVEHYMIVQYISTLSLITILFSGGLDTNIDKMRPIALKGISLSTIGVFITTIVSGLIFHFLIGLDLILSFLIGAIISSTDASAVFSIFRSGNIKLKNNLADLLELESASNDPMAYVLTISFLYLMIHPNTSIESVLLLLIQSLVFGGLFGLILGKLSIKLLKTINLEVKGLYLVLVIVLAILTFAIPELIGGNGFLAVYIAGILIGNAKLPFKDIEATFFEGLSWLMQVMMFLILGLFIIPKELIPTAGVSILIAVILILISRPLAVFISMIPFKVAFKEKIFLSWTGIKGAVPIVFAIYPLVAGITEAYSIFHIVFFITIISVVLQGGTVKFVAKKLGLIFDN